MSVDLMSYSKMDDQMAIQEAASQGLKSMEHLIRLLSHQSNHVKCADVTNLTVSKFKKVISLINRRGHARFRRGPNSQNNLTPIPIETSAIKNQTTVSSPVSFVHSQVPRLTLDFTKPNHFSSNNKITDQLEFTKETFSVSSTSSFLSSVITGDGSVSNGKKTSSLFLTAAPAASAEKPPLYKKMCHEHDHSDNTSGSGNGKCHCSKRRINRVKKVTRVPAISSKIADIPADEYSWRKYGQKPIKGSPYPRGYYKCSTVRGCSARKHVERDPNDTSMLIVTYKGEHRHSQPANQENMTSHVINKY